MKLLITALLALSFNAFADTETIVFNEAKTKASKVTFLTKGTPGFLSIEGVGGHLHGKLEIEGDYVSGEFFVPLKDFDTDIDLRNKHMREKYLEVEKYPNASLLMDKMPIQAQGNFEGLLMIKTDRKRVKGSYTYKDGLVNAKLVVNVKDFPSIGIPSFAGVTAADDVTINVSFPLKK